MPTLKLKPNARARVLSGHPWVFAGEVQKPLPVEFDGQVVECRAARGYFLGSGLYNSKSKIIWRRFSRGKSNLGREELSALIGQAISKRENGKKEKVRRLVWSESDSLPGLVVDQYEKKLVAQTLTLGMEQRLDDIVSILKEKLSPQCIVLRNDAPARKLEGLEEKKENASVAHGNAPRPQWCKISAVEFQIDLLRGQKTGFYLDQREQYGAVAALAKGRTVLDVFCNQGGFALHCAQAGAERVLGVDSSEEAVVQARENAVHNGLRAEFVADNAFDFLRQHEKQEISPDLIVLDPPPFARSKEKVADALRGYKELNLRALQWLSSGGILATYCCSHRVSRKLFAVMLADAAADAKKDVRIIARCAPPADHPVLLNVPESDYLHGFILEAV